LRGDVLEIGSGIGNFTKKIINLDSVKSITCYEIDKDCCNEFDQNILRGDNSSKVTFYEMDFNKSNLTRQFDFIFSFNVLEHIKDDQKTLHLISKYLKPGASLILYLPAMNCLYGSIDRELGHYRRYNKSMIRELFRQVPIKIEKLKYFNTIGALGWLYTNRVLNKNAQSPEMVAFYDKYVFPPMSYVERFLPTFFGANLFVKAKAERKNDSK
jgi:SAM-dependent methyltransferase